MREREREREFFLANLWLTFKYLLVFDSLSTFQKFLLKDEYEQPYQIF